jgi:hypothetical protein
MQLHHPHSFRQQVGPHRAGGIARRSLGVVLAGFHEVPVPGQGLLGQRFRFVASGRSRPPV